MRQLLVILVLAFSFADVQAQGSAVGSASLKVASHARSAALGESDIAERGRLGSFNMNPASLVGVDGIEVLLSHAQWIQDVRSEHLSTKLPFSFGTVDFIQTPPEIADMTTDADENALYLVSRAANRVLMFDRIRKRPVGEVDVGEAPSSITVMKN